jgi:hypothetical protein
MGKTQRVTDRPSPAYPLRPNMVSLALRPRHRVVLRALAEALFAHESGPREGQLEALVEGFEAHLAPVSATLRFGLVAMLDLIHWLPRLLFSNVRAFEDLTREQRVHLLERMERSRAVLLLVPLVAYKAFLSFIFFEDPRELQAMRYPGDGERKRWLKLAS